MTPCLPIVRHRWQRPDHDGGPFRVDYRFGVRFFPVMMLLSSDDPTARLLGTWIDGRKTFETSAGLRLDDVARATESVFGPMVQAGATLRLELLLRANSTLELAIDGTTENRWWTSHPEFLRLCNLAELAAERLSGRTAADLLEAVATVERKHGARPQS